MLSVPDKRRNRKSEVLLQMDGNATNRDLATWSGDKFRVADDSCSARILD